jgi:hypothetical protein
MPSTRREFLSQAALSVAVAGVGPGVASVVQALQQSPSSRPYLELALRCAQWIDKSAQTVDGALAVPRRIHLKPASFGLSITTMTECTGVRCVLREPRAVPPAMLVGAERER